jgi:hypothetical protein
VDYLQKQGDNQMAHNVLSCIIKDAERVHDTSVKEKAQHLLKHI